MVSNGYSVTLHRRDRNTYTASVCYGLDTIDNILCRDSSDIDYIIFMYLLYKAYVGVCDMCGEGYDNYVFTYDCEEAINFDDMFYHSISSLHKYFLTFIKSVELEDYKIVGKNGLNVFTFEDSVYGSFIVDYIPYTLGGQKKDLIVFRYNEFDKIYFYYDVLKRDYVIEKNDRVVKYSNMSSIVREPVDAFTKLEFEAPFHAIASGGCLSYIEMPSMTNNVKAVEQIINYIYHNIQYAEFNTKLDYCYNCGYEGEIEFKNGDWECPQCGNRDHSKLVVTEDLRLFGF